MLDKDGFITVNAMKDNVDVVCDVPVHNSFNILDNSSDVEVTTTEKVGGDDSSNTD